MRIYNINLFNRNFTGKRQDRKTVNQLQEVNSYDLNYINQRKISQAIDNLSEIPGEDNVNFLLDVSENLKYGTNIDLGIHSFNDWQVKLNNAAQKAIAKSSPNIQEQLLQRLESINTPKVLTNEEKEILKLKDSILSKVDYNELEKIKNKNIKALNRNLNYFIISSEVPLTQKLYILKRLDHFMSPEYEIHSQLTNHKTQALAEIINDITVDTPESDIPNIKAVNQKNHGMCAAISIARKVLAYEDKANFVDMIMSELDNTPYLMIYDISKLGSNKKVPINKTNIDFQHALDMGYRIIDTSAMHWMQAANTTGIGELLGMYTTFDKENFDIFQDSHLIYDLDENLSSQQDYYRSLLKTKSILKEYKKLSEISKKTNLNNHNQIKNNTELTIKLSNQLNKNLYEIAPETPAEKLKQISHDLLKLEVPTSQHADKISDYKKNFVYLPNETDSVKIEKIKAFLSITLDKKDSEILNKNVNNIFDITTTINNLNKSKQYSYIARKINRAEALYKAAAAYRIQNIFGLYIPEQANSLATNMNIPDRESLIIKNLDLLIKKVEQGKLNPKIQEHIIDSFGINNNKEELLDALYTNKEAVTLITTEILDSLFYSVLSGNRKNVLLNEISTAYDLIKNNSDKIALQEIANNLAIKANKIKVIETLEKFINILSSEDCTQEQYISIYNKFGKKNQMQDFKEIYENLGEVLFKEQNEEIIQNFNTINGLAPDAPMTETINIFEKIGEEFNKISLITTQLQNALEVRDENNEILNTVIISEVITKKLENAGEIVPAKDLKKLQQRFTAINKELNNDNGISKKLKDLPPELTKFSKAEKDLLDSIESKINGWYSQTSRLLDLQYKLLKEPLDEAHRQVGVKTGHDWISVEGHSGLNSTQQIQIIEQMTDRPYYIETNGRIAIRKIKNSPYSGVTGTSVDHKRPAMHAQYISDIKPVQIGDKLQDILFHDNTWGAKEHANTWTDENGLLRTDYNNEYGGALGYITDEKYQNGKLVDNLLSEIGHAGKIGNEYKFPMLSDIITPGRYPNAESYVRQIRQNTLLSPIMYFEELENHAKSMSRSEILSTINKTKTLGKNTHKKYMEIENKIIGNPPLEKGINTQEDYDNIPDNDELKILLEKVALSRSFKGIPDSKIFYKKTTMKELNNIKTTIRKEAQKNFMYAFGKNPEITNFGTESIRSDLNNILGKLAKENNFKLSFTQTIKIVNSLNKIQKEKFDGNLETTIKLMTDSFKDYLAKHTPNFENKDEKIENIANNVRTILRANMGFTLADLNKTSSGIVKWIDDVFAPSTDEEFVQIFKNLQHLTTEEFDAKYKSKITDEAMGIKSITGFDIVRQFKVLDESAMDSVFYMLFNEELGYNNMSETIPSYDYAKTNRILRGAYYKKNERTFDDIYLDYYFSLKSLNRHKEYDKLKTMAFKNYGLFPAYPKLDFESKEEVEKCIQTFFDEIIEATEAIDAFKVQDKSFKMVKQLKNYSKKLDNSSPVSSRQEKYIKNLIYKFLELNGEDTSIKDTIDSALQIMELEPETSGSEYKKLIDVMYEELNKFATTADGKTMAESIKSQLEVIKDKKREFIMNIIEPKYQNKAYEIVNKWISAIVKNNPDASYYFAEFEKFFDKHRIIKSPEVILNEYLLLLAKPEKEGRQYSPAEAKQLEDVKDVYRVNIQSLLSCANILEMQQILMNCARKGNLNIVRDEFKNSQIMLNDGRIVNLDSNEGLSILIKPLLANEDLDTLVMFIEQLGLTDRVIEMFIKDIKFDKVYKNIKRIDNILLSASKQTEIIKKELQKLGNIDNDPNYEEKLNIAKENIIKKFKNTNYRRAIKIVEEGFKRIQEDTQNHPELSKTAYVHLYMENVKTATLYIATQQIEQLNIKLQAYQKIYDLIRSLKIRKDSPVKPLLDKYFEEINKIEKYAESHTRNYKNLDIKTGNYAL